MTGKKLIPVLALPMFEADTGRADLQLPTGLTIIEIVRTALPNARLVDLAQVRVTLVNERGSIVVDPQHWAVVKPKPGAHVVIRVVPGKDFLKSILQIVVSIAAIALGQLWAPALAGALGISPQLAQGLIGLGVNLVGNLLINALIPPPKRTENDQKPTYQISGWRNPLNPDGTVPDVLGRHRYAPPFAAYSYTEIVGDLQYVRAVFTFGYGRLALSDFRIGETSLSEYDEVDIEVREGVASDLPVTIFPRQIVEESVGAELARPFQRDDFGEVIEGPTLEKPVVRTTGADASGASIILTFPGGLCHLNDEGNRRSVTVAIRIRQRLAGATEWQDVETLVIVAAKLEGFFRQHTWEFPSRGRWEVEVTRMTDEITSSQTQSRSTWVALQTLRPEYPLNFGEPLALVALRIKATYQLNGALDNFNAVAERYCLDWDAPTQTWIYRTTRNPASLFRYVLQSKANAYPEPDSGIDLELLQDWHAFCTAKGLKYDRVHDFDGSLEETLTAIAAAGRASPRHDGLKWGVVIDRPQQLVVDHINPRNSYQFRWSRTYFDPPHAFRISFLDETNDYQSAERIVRWPGHDGDIVVTEQIDLPGKTDPAEIYIEAKRRMYELLHRPDRYSAIQDGVARVVTRGDLVMANYDVLVRTQIAAKVRTASGRLVELDDEVQMETGVSYAIRFRVFEDDEDTIGLSVLRNVLTKAGSSVVLHLTGDGPLPAIGDLVHFGEAAAESLPLLVAGIEPGEDFSSVLSMIDAAPIIDELTDAEVVPAWSGRVGEEIDENLLQPPAPRFVAIRNGFEGTDNTAGLDILLEPGSGPIATAKYVVEHRLVGAPTWTAVTIPAANGGLAISAYVRGNAVQLRAHALSFDGIAGPLTAVVSLTIGSGDAAIPAALDSATVTVAALLGGSTLMFSTSDDAAATQIQLYRSTSAVLNQATDKLGAPIPVQPSRSYSVPDGDTTRANLLINGNMDSAGTWALGGGWAISGGTANHVAGSASGISQALAAVAGKFYRVAFTLSGVSAGSLTPRLTGGSTRAGTARNANGSYSDRIQAVTGNNTFGFVATTDFVGSLDNVVVFLETATSLAAGTYYYWLEPLNADGAPGPVSGPFSVVIR